MLPSRMDSSGFDVPTPHVLNTNPKKAVDCLVIRWALPGAPGVVLKGPQVRLGKNAALAVCVNGLGVSREHAEFSLLGPMYRLRDLGSRNGTFVNGRQLSADPIEYCPVRTGDVLRFGDTVGVVVQEPEAAVSTDFSELLPGLWGGFALAQATSSVPSVAKHSAPVVVVGETGTGKEVVAKAIHQLSGRSGPVYGVNCAAVPESLAESEFFGHGKGAFTGAGKVHVGHLRAADKGTLILDEIGDLSPLLQAKLLRVLEEREVVPVGSTTPISIDVKIVVAAQTPLADLVKRGKLRSDLATRLSGAVISLPPLHTHPGDVFPLFCRFFHKESGGMAAAMSHRFIESLVRYPWPYNARELLHLAAGLAAQFDGSQGDGSPALHRSMLPEYVQEPDSVPQKSIPSSFSPGGNLQNDELSTLKEALREHSGSVTAAANQIGISRARAYRLLHGQSPKSFIK